MNKKRAFSLAESMISLLIMMVLMAMATPFIRLNYLMNKYDPATMKCVRSELAADLASAACLNAIRNGQYERGNGLSTLVFLADHGKSDTEKSNAKKVLQKSCDNGGKSACMYFIDTCKKDSAFCDYDDANTNFGSYDLKRYLTLAMGTDSVKALAFIDYAKLIYNSGNTNVKTIVNNICCVDGSLNVACVIKGQTECPVLGYSAYCWGWNGFGQLGNGTTTDTYTPVVVSGGLLFTKISAGYYHSCGITTDGAAYCWGYNNSGQLGNNSTTNSSTPVAVSGGHFFSEIATGTYHTCGLTTSGQVYCWGDGSNGALGNGGSSNKLVPTLINLNDLFKYVSAGNNHSCVITTGNQSYCFGYNVYGQLGNGTYTSFFYSPTLVSGGYSFSQISPGWAGFNNTCAITTAGKAYCWGHGNTGALGNGDSSDTDYSTPQAVSGTFSFTQIDAGTLNGCGIISGQVYCWGNNGVQQLAASYGASPTKAYYDSNTYIYVGVGDDHTCGLTTTGSVYCAGNTPANGNSSSGYVFLVPGSHTFNQISAGGSHNCGLVN